MIPKIIHYCWFGRGEMPELYKKCLSSWKKILPEYKVFRWDESTFDITSNIYVKEAYENKKYAFVTDYVRLFALYKYGGIYMDTDVEVVRPLDQFLSCEAFSGFEKKDSVPTGIIGAEKENRVIGDLLRDYDSKKFLNEDGSFNLTTNVVTITHYFIKHGISLNGKEQTIEGFHMFPQNYFCTNSILIVFNAKPHKAYTIHHYGGGWEKDGKKIQNLPFRTKRFLVGVLRNAIGSEKTAKIGAKIKRLNAK